MQLTFFAHFCAYDCGECSVSKMLSCCCLAILLVVPVLGQPSGQEYVHAECGSVKVCVHCIE